MKRGAPPAWLEHLLALLLPARNRATITGDLREEFIQHKCPQLGRLHACIWYVRQLISFVPGRLASLFARRRGLTAVCIFTALSGMWLGAMDFRLRHPGYGDREWIAGTIVLQAVLTLAALYLRRLTPLRFLAITGTAAILWLAGKALLATVRGSHPEGYVLFIALALLLQAVLTIFTVPNRPKNQA